MQIRIGVGGNLGRLIIIISIDIIVIKYGDYHYFR